MTNPVRPTDADDPQTWEHVPKIPSPEEIDAELQDADDQVLSKGVAALYNAHTAEFQPHDKADVEMLRNRAKILFLKKEKKSLSISSISVVEEHPVGQRIRIPLILSLFLAALLFGTLSSYGQQSSPAVGSDEYIKRELVLWPYMIDQTQDDRETQNKVLVGLARNKFFDPEEQARLHPEYRKYAEQIAKIRAILREKNAPPKSVSVVIGEFAGYFSIPFGLAIWWVCAWARKVKVNTHSYWLVVLKMTWRTALVWIAVAGAITYMRRDIPPPDIEFIFALFVLLIACVTTALFASKNPLPQPANDGH